MLEKDNSKIIFRVIFLVHGSSSSMATSFLVLCIAGSLERGRFMMNVSLLGIAY